MKACYSLYDFSLIPQRVVTSPKATARAASPSTAASSRYGPMETGGKLVHGPMGNEGIGAMGDTRNGCTDYWDTEDNGRTDQWEIRDMGARTNGKWVHGPMGKRECAGLRAIFVFFLAIKNEIYRPVEHGARSHGTCTKPECALTAALPTLTRSQ